MMHRTRKGYINIMDDKDTAIRTVRSGETIKPRSTRTFNDRLMKVLRTVNFLSGKSLDESDLAKHRRNVERAGRLTAPRANITVTAFTVGDLPCEKVTPEYAHNPQYAILYAHGGGYISGGLNYARILASKMATATGFSVYTFAYRLAPEHPYPAAIDDGMMVWEHLTESRYAPGHIFIAGDSAGGNLALCMIQRLLSEKRPVPAGVLLFSPWTDMTGTSTTYESNRDIDPILSGDYVMSAAAAYTGNAGSPDDPVFSPLFGDFKGFPPAFIMAGRNEILLDDSVQLRSAILEAGGRAVLDIEENGFHVYQQLPINIAERAMKRLASHVSSEVYGDE